MRVLVLGLDLDRPGGIQRYVATLIRSLRSALGEDSVRVASYAPSRTSAMRRPKQAAFASRVVVQGLAWRPDIIIATHVNVAPLAHLAAKSVRARVWTMCHGVEVWRELSTLHRRALRRSDIVLANSRFTRDIVRSRHNLDATRMRVLPCAYDESLLDAKGSSSLLAEVGDRPVVLTVGRLSADERYKGHEQVLRALTHVRRHTRDVVYLVAGDGSDRPRLEALAKELGVADGVRFLGFVPDPDLAECYRRCDVFAMPARTVLEPDAPQGEGFGIAYLEAMAFGKPVIGGADGAAAELVRDGIDGLLVDPRDVEAVGSALGKLLSSSEDRERMGLAAKGRAQEFTEAALGRRVRLLLQEARS